MDASEELGITKWESPTDRAGQQKRKKFKWYSWRAWYWAVVDWLAKRKIEGCTPPFHVKKYDVENFKRFPVIKEGERVVVTEKIHGANARFVWSSKLGKMCIGSHTMWKSPDQPSWWTNAVQQNKWIAEVCRENPDVVFYGEVFGASVQPLSYGYGKGEFGIRLFDIYEPGVGWAANERVESYWWLDDRVRDHWVPVLYRGPYEEGLIRNLAEGKETISGLKLHIREGVVVETEVPREEVGLGRVKLKIINPAYYEEKAYGNH
jgi:RNA ligase (TIGR02306 family)